MKFLTLLLFIGLFSPIYLNAQEDNITEPNTLNLEQLADESETLTAEEQLAIDEASAAATEAIVGCTACSGIGIALFIAFIVLNIALLIWVAKDSKSRGMDSSVLWMLLVMTTGLIGLIIYIFARPQGQLTQCPSCNGQRMSASAKCPHCQNA